MYIERIWNADSIVYKPINIRDTIKYHNQTIKKYLFILSRDLEY